MTTLAPAIVDGATRREFLTMLGAAGLLAACGDGGVPSQSAPAPAEGFPRTVDNFLGTTTIAAPPVRVAALDSHSLVDATVALGTDPVVALGVPPWVADEIDPTLAEGTEQTSFVNLEAVAAARPDVIIGFQYQEELAPQLQAIAPTVLIADSAGWMQVAVSVAEVLGAEDRLAERMRAYDARTAEIRAGIVEGRRSVSLFRPQPDTFIAYSQASDAGGVLEECGVVVADPPPGEPFGEIGNRCSLERLGELTGDTIFVISYDIEEDQFDSLYSTNPLWAQLSAVQAGRVVPVDGLAWTNFNLLGAQVLLDELGEGLAS